jgi:phenylacetate-coenzyme A ligase PaaK-like adenylate-forming protein
MTLAHADLGNAEYLSWKAFLHEASCWSADAISAHQLTELRRVVTDAWTHAPAYRALCDRFGVSPDDIRTLDDVRRLPFVDKALIRPSLDAFSIPMEGRTRTATGGSTGIPFELYRDPGAFARELASKAHQYERIGWREGDRQFVLRGLPVEAADHMTMVPELGELRCSSYHLVPEVMERYRQAAIDYRPEWVRCYPSIGHLFAQFLQDSGRPFPPVRGVLCASENLYDSQKTLLAKVFGGRVFSHYGHYELAVLAGFCEHRDTYHVLPQYGYAELIAADGSAVTTPGRIGEIAGTSFINRGTPLIRYRTGDCARLEAWSCAACGRPYQIWSRIEGRLHEFIVTSTGRLISMTALNAHDDTFDEVRQFQYVQERAGEVTLQYVPRFSWDPAVESRISARLAPKLGTDVILRMQPVQAIEATARGKHRFLIQRLTLAAGDR